MDELLSYPFLFDQTHSTCCSLSLSLSIFLFNSGGGISSFSSVSNGFSTRRLPAVVTTLRVSAWVDRGRCLCPSRSCHRTLSGQEGSPAPRAAEAVRLATAGVLAARPVARGWRAHVHDPEVPFEAVRVLSTTQAPLLRRRSRGFLSRGVLL